MSNLIIAELHGSKIRRTDDGRFSVYDLIRVAGGKKSEREVWKRITEQFPECVTKCDAVELGTGQAKKLTPVANSENCLYILGLLPGICGQAYREKAANIVRRYIEGDADLGAELIARDKDRSRVDRAQKRILMTETNKQVAQLASETGIKHSQLHNDRYKGLYRKTAQQLRDMADLTHSDSPLSRMSSRDLTMNSLANQLAIEAGDGTDVFDFANDIRESYQKRMGKKLEPKFEENILRPQDARDFLSESKTLTIAQS
jgi:hypothetical protein